MSVFVIIEEWWEPRNEQEKAHYHVSAYGRVSDKRADDLRGQMEKYSPYDYAICNTYGTKEEYNQYLETLKRGGATFTSEISYK